jgi:hypothetical protein
VAHKLHLIQVHNSLVLKVTTHLCHSGKEIQILTLIQVMMRVMMISQIGEILSLLIEAMVQDNLEVMVEMVEEMDMQMEGTGEEIIMVHHIPETLIIQVIHLVLEIHKEI